MKIPQFTVETQFPRRPVHRADTRCNSIVEENVSASFRLLSRMLRSQFQISCDPARLPHSLVKRGEKWGEVWGCVRVESKLIRREIKSSEIPKCVEVSNPLLIGSKRRVIWKVNRFESHRSTEFRRIEASFIPEDPLSLRPE